MTRFNPMTASERCRKSQKQVTKAHKRGRLKQNVKNVSEDDRAIEKEEHGQQDQQVEKQE